MNHCLGCQSFGNCAADGVCRGIQYDASHMNRYAASRLNDYAQHQAHNRAQLATAGTARMTKPTAERAQALVAELNEVAMGLRAAGWTVEVIATGPEFPVKLSLGWRSSEDDHS